jgi:hypothetical protein
MTDEERTKMQLRARESAAEYSYGDSSNNSGRILEVRKARNPAHYLGFEGAAV